MAERVVRVHEIRSLSGAHALVQRTSGERGVAVLVRRLRRGADAIPLLHLLTDMARTRGWEVVGDMGFEELYLRIEDLQYRMARLVALRRRVEFPTRGVSTDSLAHALATALYSAGLPFPLGDAPPTLARARALRRQARGSFDRHVRSAMAEAFAFRRMVTTYIAYMESLLVVPWRRLDDA